MENSLPSPSPRKKPPRSPLSGGSNRLGLALRYNEQMLRPVLTDITTLKQVLGRAGIRLDPKQSQHFLILPEVVKATVAALDGGPKLITELGAGVGTLTQALAAHGYIVRAIERDKALAAALPGVLAPKERERVEVVAHDLREVKWEYEEPYQLVGNIPYAFSGLILRRITQLSPAPERVVLLVQKEVGQRIIAQTPDMNLLGLAVQLWSEAEKLLLVPKNCFFPPPKVDSMLVMLIPNTDQSEEREAILKVAKIAFQAKRKQLQTSLRQRLGVSAEDIQKVLHRLGLSGKARPQELSVEQWKQLAQLVRQ